MLVFKQMLTFLKHAVPLYKALYCILFLNIHKHYNYLQPILKRRCLQSFRKSFKMSSWRAWIDRPVGVIKSWGWNRNTQSDLLGCQMEVENVSLRLKNRNQSKLLQDIIEIKYSQFKVKFIVGVSGDIWRVMKPSQPRRSSRLKMK
jgi:hypothetical protein